MKILFISNGYPPRQWAGTETYTAGLAQGLHRLGHSVQVLCGGDWERGAAYWNGTVDDIHHGVSVRRINMNWTKANDPARYLYNDPVTAAFLTDYLTELQPDVVHVTSCERLSASVLKVVKDAGLPLVLSLTDFWFLCPRMSLLRTDGTNCTGQTTPWECLECTMRGSRAYRWADGLLSKKTSSQLLTELSRRPFLARQRGLRGMIADMADRKSYLARAIRLPDRRLTASEFVRNVHMANGVAEPIDLHPYGHDLRWLKAYRGKTASHRLRIGYIGQIIERKGLTVLLEAAQAIAQEWGDRFELVIYGSLRKQPDYSRRLQVLAATVPNVDFRGTYARDQSANVFAGLDVLAVPSLWYDFPLVIYEAFATKTPVIAANLGGMAEAVTHKHNGLLFKPGDVDDLAAQLTHALNDPELLPKLRNGIPSVRTVEEELEALVSIYAELTAATSPALISAA